MGKSIKMHAEPPKPTEEKPINIKAITVLAESTDNKFYVIVMSASQFMIVKSVLMSPEKGTQLRTTPVTDINELHSNKR